MENKHARQKIRMGHERKENRKASTKEGASEKNI